MFDVSFAELFVIALVALVVIGPERLPKVARTAGHLLGRLQRYVNDVKAEINREMQLDELHKLRTQVEQSARDVETNMTKEMHTVEDSLNKAISSPTETVPPSSPKDPSDPAILTSPLQAGDSRPTRQVETTLDSVGSPKQNA